jgi:enterochelin esterase family protein
VSKARIEQPILESHTLQGNYFNDPIARPVTVYLPPDYDANPSRRYPVVYLLPSHGSTGQSLLNWKPWEPSLPDRFTRWITEGTIPPAIVVMPDSWTMLGSSQYLNSAIGNYEDYLIGEIVPFVDAHYRTGGRGILGFSSGGYGAIVQAMRHPEVFSAVACYAADMYWEYTCLPSIAGLHQALVKYGGAEQFLKDIPGIEPKGGTFWKTVMTLCWSMAHGSNPNAPLGFDLPIDPETGALDEAVWQKWLTFDPLRMIEDPAYQAALRGMKQVYVSAGAADEYQLQIGARLFSRKLNQVGILHVYEETLGGHSSADVPYDRMMGLVIQSLV